jgi:hypothetical protein
MPGARLKEKPMETDKSKVSGLTEPSARPDSGGEAAPAKPAAPNEPGAAKRPDPTRYGDWERAGRCIDF